MNIVLIGGSMYDSNNGPYHSLKGLSNALSKAGNNVFVIGSKDNNKQNFKVEDYGIENVYALDKYGPYSLHYTPMIKNFLDSLPFKPDIFICQSVWMYNCYLASRFCTKRKIPYVISTRGNLSKKALSISRFKKSIAKLFFVNRYLDNSVAFHALNDVERKQIQNYGIHKPIIVCPNGINIPEKIIKNSFNKTVLYLGRIHPIKNLENTLIGYSQIPISIRQKWKFQIAGTGDHRYVNQIKQLCSRLRLTEYVEFLGFVEGRQKNEILSNSSIFILESHSEGMPMSVLEAMAFENPVIISKNCNLADVEKYELGKINDGTTEQICSDLSAMMILRKSEINELGRKAKSYVTKKLTWDSIANYFLNEIKEVI